MSSATNAANVMIRETMSAQRCGYGAALILLAKKGEIVQVERPDGNREWQVVPIVPSSRDGVLR